MGRAGDPFWRHDRGYRPAVQAECSVTSLKAAANDLAAPRGGNRHGHDIEQPERVGGWLRTTARRESLQLLKRASRYRSGADQMLANMADAHLPEPDARPIAEEREVVVRAVWGRLKPRCQELLSLLMTGDPLGYKDLSALLQMPVGSIGPTRQRCLEHLRRLIEEEGMPVSEAESPLRID